MVNLECELQLQKDSAKTASVPPGSFGDKFRRLVRTPSSRAIAFRAINLRCSSDILLMNLDWSLKSITSKGREMERFERSVTDPITGEIYCWHPLTLTAKANQEDCPSLREVLRMDRKQQDEWHESMQEEMTALEDKGTFKLIPREEAEQTGEQIVPTI